MKSSSPKAISFPRRGEASTKIIPVLFGLSGALALVYEVVWQRQFALVFGSAAPATVAILIAYFAGLGLGAYLIGQWSHRWNNPLLAYGALELIIGAGVLLVSPILATVEKIYPQLFQRFSEHPGIFLSLRMFLAFGALLIPTFAMGGTLPLLGNLVDRGQKRLGLTAGWLYVVNTAGAAAGALGVPFFFLPHFGLQHTVWLGAALNAGLAFVAWQLSRSPAPVREISSKSVSKKKRLKPAPAVENTHASTAWLALISGAATFALQVLWNRAFAQVHENSMYSFAIIVAVVIAALALGAQIARSSLRREIAPYRLIAIAWILAGLIVIASPWIFLNLSHGLDYLSGANGWSLSALRLTGQAVAAILAPMALIGVGLPAIMEQVGRDRGTDAAQSLGRLFSINVIGSIVGSAVSGFVLPQWLGLWNSFFWVGVLLIGVGVFLSSRLSRSPTPKIGYIFACGWLASGFLIAQLHLPRVSLDLDHREQLIAIAEGAQGITAVVERPHSRRLKLNNHYGLGGTASTGDERMQAHIPLLLHPAPRKVAFLGLGTGITAGGALFHPVENITVIELVPEVVQASRDFFREANRGVLEERRVKVVADDARHSLRRAGEYYDVIVGDLVVPWRQGEGSLFTLEQFVAARDALAPGGLFCQWLPMFQLSETEVNILTRTFLKVFPHTQIWRGDFSPTEPAIALIGSIGDQPLNAALLRQKLAEMQSDPTNPQLQSPEDFWMNYVGNLEAADLPAQETRLNRDDRPWIEMLGPLNSREESDKPFTGRQLQAWLDQITLRSAPQIAKLPASEASAVAAGSVMGKMTIAFSENDQDAAKLAQDQLRKLLPNSAFEKLF